MFGCIRTIVVTKSGWHHDFVELLNCIFWQNYSGTLWFCQTHDHSKHALNIIFILKKMLTSSSGTLVKQANIVKHSCHLCNLSFQNIKNASIQNLLFLVFLTIA
jgi:hypothetical protein